jgi:hypothetical protein
MVRNETFDQQGNLLHADVFDLDTGTYRREEAGQVVEERPMTADEVAAFTPEPDPVAVLEAEVAELKAALTALLGGAP